ncbi:MAG: hypothetical protein JO122_06420 [Acetobacteraceae bacterium]|nr:hypothetical protein [Acetobacteraceae bacterium]
MLIDDGLIFAPGGKPIIIEISLIADAQRIAVLDLRITVRRTLTTNQAVDAR